MRLVLCENAVVHPDGTFSVDRGGISAVQTNLPCRMHKVLLLDADRGELPVGRPLSFVASMSGVEGDAVGSATAIVPPPGERFLAAVPVQVTIRSYGTVRIRIDVENVSASVEIVASPRPQTDN